MNYFMGLVLLSLVVNANNELKKAFSEGIKASIQVVEHEKSQALHPIPEGYCATITTKKESLTLSEEVKLESLALYLKFSPSLYEVKVSTTQRKRILCLAIAKDKEKAIDKLKQLEKLYPKLTEYITKVEILPTQAIHRVIPGVGQYYKDESANIASLKKALNSDVKIPNKVIGLKKKKNYTVLYDNNSTRVLSSTIAQVLFVEHTVYRSRKQ